MFDIRVCDSGARIIRDALRLYKERWPGGHPQEQEDIDFLETQFTKMVLESTIDAWLPRHGTGSRFIPVRTMSDLEKRYIIKEYQKMLREEKEIALCYRGTAYKKTVLN